MQEQQARAWDEAATTYDLEADHGLADPAVRAAWTALLARHLPTAPSRVADLGCGTGSLTLLVAGLGHQVVGVDFSEQMLTRAKTKLKAHPDIGFVRGDAARPPLRDHSFDVVLSRHVLWALPDPAAAVDRWIRLLRPDGRLVLIEGRWSTGAGLAADDVVSMLRGAGRVPIVERLADPSYWGGPITDDRYLVVGSAARPDGE